MNVFHDDAFSHTFILQSQKHAYLYTVLLKIYIIHLKELESYLNKLLLVKFWKEFFIEHTELRNILWKVHSKQYFCQSEQRNHCSFSEFLDHRINIKYGYIKVGYALAPSCPFFFLYFTYIWYYINIDCTRG